MQLAGQTADIALFLEQLGDQFFILGEFVVSVKNGLCGPGIAAGHKAGAAGGTDRGLGIRSCESDTLLCQPVEVRRVDIGIAQTMDGIPPLLVCTEPYNIILFAHNLPPLNQICHFIAQRDEVR